MTNVEVSMCVKEYIFVTWLIMDTSFNMRNACKCFLKSLKLSAALDAAMLELKIAFCLQHGQLMSQPMKLMACFLK